MSGAVAEYHVGRLTTAVEDRWLDFEQTGGTRAARAKLQTRFHNHWPEVFRFLHETFRQIRAERLVTLLSEHLSNTAALIAEARRPLIHRVRNQVEQPLEQLRHRLTRNLARRHQMMPLRRIQEIDAHCIRHVTRQPGRDMAEKAGVRQELLGIQRTVTHDSWENRFLKAFLDLLRTECENHRINPEALDVESDRRGLTAFTGQLEQVLSSHELAAVGTLAMSRVRLNNVLQRRPDYRHMYRSFLFLQREKRLVASLWPHRVSLLADFLFWHLAGLLARLNGARVPRELPTLLEHPVQGSMLVEASYAVALATSRHAWNLTVRRTPPATLIDLTIEAVRQSLEAPLSALPTRFELPCWVYWGEPSPETLARGERLIARHHDYTTGLVLVLAEDPEWQPPPTSLLRVVVFRYHEAFAGRGLQDELFTVLHEWLARYDH